jgi:hypothetical protein
VDSAPFSARHSLSLHHPPSSDLPTTRDTGEGRERPTRESTATSEQGLSPRSSVPPVGSSWSSLIGSRNGHHQRRAHALEAMPRAGGERRHLGPLQDGGARAAMRERRPQRRPGTLVRHHPLHRADTDPMRRSVAVCLRSATCRRHSTPLGPCSCSRPTRCQWPAASDLACSGSRAPS